MILYSQCWEDQEILEKALCIGSSDTVLSITSGGCNSLSLLINNPKKLHCIDRNPEQNFLLELKMAAFENLDYESLLKFLGETESANRTETYEQIRPKISPDAMNYWNAKKHQIKNGINNCGKFERYLWLFRKSVLRFTQDKEKINKLLSFENIKEQDKFYTEKWDGLAWRFFFKVYFGNSLIKLGRKKQFFAHSQIQDVGAHYLRLVEKSMKRILWSKSPYCEYLLTGKHEKNLPVYLLEKNFEKIKNGMWKIQVSNTDATDFLQKMESPLKIKANFSDIFEYMNPKDTARHFEILKKKAKKGSRICFWNNLVRRELPSNMIKDKSSEKLQEQDKVVFYSKFNVGEL